MLQGYLLSVEKGKNGEIYNLGHGAGISIGDLVILSAKVANMTEKDYELIVDEARYRKADVEVLICDFSKAKRLLGYYPQLPIIKSIKASLNYFEKNPRLMLMERH